MRRLFMLVTIVLLVLPMWCRAQESAVVFEETFQSGGRWATANGGALSVADGHATMTGPSDKAVVYCASRIPLDLDEGLVFEAEVSYVSEGSRWWIMMGAGDGWWAAPNFGLMDAPNQHTNSYDLTSLASKVGLTGIQDMWIVFWVEGSITVDSLRITSKNPKPASTIDTGIVYEQDFRSTRGVSAYGDAVEYSVAEGMGILTNRDKDEAYVVFGPVFVNLDDDLILEFRVSDVQSGALWNLNVGYKEEWWQGPHARPYGTDMIYIAKDVMVSLTDIVKEQAGVSGEQNLYFTFDIRNGRMVLEYLQIRRK